MVGLRSGTITGVKPEELSAAVCGTAPEVLSRTFRRLTSERLVEVRGRVATILDPSGLATLALAGREAIVASK